MKSVEICLFIIMVSVVSSWGIACGGGPKSPACGDGWSCPVGQVCVPGHKGHCGMEGEVDACLEKYEGEPCTYSESSGWEHKGVCLDGVCMIGCLNGHVDEGEVCDGAPPTEDTCLLRGFDMGRLECSDGCDSVVSRNCGIFGWKRHRAEVDWQFGGVWGSSLENIYSAGFVGSWDLDFAQKCAFQDRDCGRIFHHDGERWTVQETGTPLLADVWGSGPDNLFAVGAGGTILHSRDGSTWSSVYDDNITHQFISIWGSGAHDIFVADVGGAILHFDGEAWTEMRVPSTRGSYLLDMWGSGPSDIYVVGTAGMIMHYDGNARGQWVKMESYTERDVLGVWGTGPDNVIAVGEDHLVLRYTGSPGDEWSMVHTGSKDDRLLMGIRGHSAEEIYLYGLESPILKYNSVDSSIEEVTHSTEHLLLTSAWNDPSGELWLFGVNGIALQAKPEFNWSATEIERPGVIHDLWGDSASGASIAVGERVWQQRDGRWRPMAAEHRGVLTAVWGSSMANVFAVSSEGEILHHDGRSWSAMVSGTTAHLTRVWGTAGDEVFAVGHGGTILYHDGDPAGRWQPMNATTTANLEGVWGADASDMYAVGEGGVILHFDGNPEGTWRAMENDNPVGLNAVWGNDGDDVFAAGDGGVILHHVGDSAIGWQLMSTSTIGEIHDLWGDSFDNVIAVGYSGIILHYDGRVWSRIRAVNQEDILAVWGTSSPRRITVAGDDGSVRSLSFYMDR